jgi:hypothetical protein
MANDNKPLGGSKMRYITISLGTNDLEADERGINKHKNLSTIIMSSQQTDIDKDLLEKTIVKALEGLGYNYLPEETIEDGNVIWLGGKPRNPHEGS